MPAATSSKGAQNAPAQQAAAYIPFLDGTYEYSEVIQTLTFTPGATTQDFSLNITPGGFLRGVSIYVNGAGGTLGAGVAAADYPWNIFNSLSTESIDGTPLLYPMSGYAYYLATRFTRPQVISPSKDAAFVNGINPVFRLPLFHEQKATLGVLPNTDARAQYRVRGTINTLGQMFTTAPTTAPTLTVTFVLETYAQPPRQTLSGAPIQQLPDGLAVQRFLSHQIDVLPGGTATIKLNRVGNLIRTIMLVMRDSTGAHVALTADPIRLRVDNTQLFVEQRQRRDYMMQNRFSWNDQEVNPTGLYVYPRWEDKGSMQGVGWLETAEATFLQFELNGAPAGGTCETIIEDLALTAPIPGYLENI